MPKRVYIRIGKIIPCFRCGKKVYRNPSAFRPHTYCSRICSNIDKAPLISKMRKGIKIPEKTKEKLRKYVREKNSNWQGGKPHCSDCNLIINYRSKHCAKCKMKYRTKEHQLKLNHSISESLKGKMPLNIMQEGKYNNVKRGWFEIEGKKLFFRSTWEANYALYLSWLKKIKQIKDWQYEPDVFIFHKIQFGTRSYRPDFKIINFDGSFYYDEIKGYMDSKSLTKLKRMRIYYPEIIMNLIEKKDYNSIKRKVGKMLHFY